MDLATLSRQRSAILYSSCKIEGGIRSHKEAQKSTQAEFFASFAPFCGDLHFVVLSQSFLERVLKTGSAGDSPAPVGDPPTGTALSLFAKRPFSSGGSPDGTAGSPVLPGNYFPNRL